MKIFGIISIIVFIIIMIVFEVTTVSISVSYESARLFSFIIMGLVVFMSSNALLYKYFYKNTNTSNYFHYQLDNIFKHYMIPYGIILYPLFKNIIKDSWSFNISYYKHKMYEPVSENDAEGKGKQILYMRQMKMLKIKYKRLIFVKRKVFSTFVIE